MKNLPSLTVNGYGIRVDHDNFPFGDEDKISLTDLWKASGGDSRNHPTMWLRNDGTEEFIQALRGNTNLEKSQLLSVKAGRTGGTWAHWQIALAYAKYLSPELHMAVNEVIC